MEIAENQVTSLEVSDSVLSFLAKNGASETPDISFGTGIAPREISLAIHELKKHNYVETIKITDGRTGTEITRHELLPAADRLTSVMLAYKEKREAQRRFLAKGHPRLSTGKKKGQHHIHGVVGKHDLTKIPKGIPGKLYLALTKPKMSARQVSEAANLQLQQTWNGLTTLVKLGYIKFDLEKSNPRINKPIRLYSRIIDIRSDVLKSPDDIQLKGSGPRKKRKQEPPAPKAKDMKPDASLPDSQQAIKDFINQNESLDEITVDVLLEKLDATDVLLAAAAQISDENRRLRALLKDKL